MDAELTRLRQELAQSAGANAGPLVTDALGAVPRHLFLPGVPAELVYSDEAVVTKRDTDGLPLSSSSQPGLMATMLGQLNLAAGNRVLEIGAGTGYNAALIRHITGPTGIVVSIDIDQDTVDGAREHLTAAGYPDVTVLCRDGAEGAAEYAPFDRLIATVGLSDLSSAWLAQLTEDARIVAPIEVRGPMLSVAFERGEGHWASRSVLPCGFIKVRGALAGSSHDMVITDTITIHLPERRDVDVVGLASAVTSGIPVRAPTGIGTGTPSVMWGIYPWLCGTDPRACGLGESGPPGRLPETSRGGKGFRVWSGLVSGASLAVLAVPEDGELTAVGYGPDGGELASALAEATRAWHAAGRPATEDLHVDAYPPGAEIPPRAGMVIDRPATRFVIYRT
jgi:protein-L-isoaspartate(D-aspartate) O-methyltransferase